MLHCKRPRFGSEFEPLGDRVVPAVTAYFVNTFADTPFDRVDPDTGVPVDVNGAISLRAVVEYANFNPETGNPDENNYVVALPNGTITLDESNGTLVIESNMNFLGGAGAAGASTTVERSVAAAAFRLFHVVDHPVFGDVTVNFNAMTLRGGQAPTGGAILVDEDASVRVANCTFTNNTASSVLMVDAHGGAIYASPGSSVRINSSVLGLNSATDGGGAIYAAGAAELLIYDSSIIGNWLTGANRNGGGLFIEDTVTRIGNTSIIGNEATGKGGGMYVTNFTALVADPVLEMVGGQLHGNTAGSDGGGIYVDLQARSDAVVLDRVSVTQNGAGGKGGGAYIRQGTLAGELTALTGNTATGGIPGIAFKRNMADATIILPPDQQIAEQDP